MTWYGYALIAYEVVVVAIMILLIGKPREPITPGVALFGMTIAGLIVSGALVVGTGHLG
jgi:hypothetical protein